MTAPQRPLAPDYWILVYRQFRKRRTAVLAAIFVLVLFMAAIFAPFLASEAPLLLESADGWTSPVLSELTRADLSWLAGLVAAVAGLTAHALLRRKSPERSRMSASLGVGLAVLAIALVAVRVGVRHVAHREDWPTRVAAAERDGFTAIRAPIPYSPISGSLLSRLKPPGEAGHLLGTDTVGRDVAARMVWGTRVSLIVGFVAVSIYVTIGIVLGSLGGYFGGGVDMALQRLVEVVTCFPTLFLILAVLAFLPPSIFNIMALIGVTGWTGVSRLVRGEILRLRGQDFVVASHALGAPARRVIVRHLLPNALAPVLVSATFGVAGAILLEAGLSFLGFGVPPPTPSWGSSLFDARPYITTHPWLPLYPGLAIFLTVTAYNLVGEGLRDALDPRLKA